MGIELGHLNIDGDEYKKDRASIICMNILVVSLITNYAAVY